MEALPGLTQSQEQGEAQEAAGTRGQAPAIVRFAAQNAKQNDKRVCPSPQVPTPRRTRTYDPLIKSQLLYQLS